MEMAPKGDLGRKEEDFGRSISAASHASKDRNLRGRVRGITQRRAASQHLSAEVRSYRNSHPDILVSGLQAPLPVELRPYVGAAHQRAVVHSQGAVCYPIAKINADKAAAGLARHALPAIYGHQLPAGGRAETQQEKKQARFYSSN